jgi:hypothetical protein
MEFETMAARKAHKGNGNGNGNGNGQIKRVLRHRHSREYFKDGGWTNNPDEADSFSDVVEAAQTCARYRLNGVELALRFETGCDVFCTPIR